MDDAGKVQEYLALSRNYLRSGELNLRERNWEPAMSAAIHSIELAVKAAILTREDEVITKHQVAGTFGRLFRNRVGADVCKDIALVLMKYNLPRYPGEKEIMEEDVVATVDIARELLSKIVPDIIRGSRS